MALQDLAYTPSYHNVQAPRLLQQVCVMQGIEAPDLSQPFNYLDLGCGFGVSPLVFAGCYPHGQFFGIDLNPHHVASAQQVADNTGLTNTLFLAQAFESVDLDTLPMFDMITMHGVFAWIPDAAKQAVVNIIQARLKPGGIFFVSYNALPAWGAISMVRDMLRTFASHIDGDPITKVRFGLRQMNALLKAKAPFFEYHPVARRVVERLRGADLHYIAHEYLAEVSEPLWSHDVAAWFAPAEVELIGQLPLSLNIPQLNHSDDLSALLNSHTDPQLRLALGSFANNEMFRSDVFMRVPITRHDDAHGGIRETVFGSVILPSNFKSELRFPAREVKLQEPLFNALRDALAQGAGTVSELRTRHPALAAFDEDAVLFCLQMLLFKNQLTPFIRSTRTPDPATLPRTTPLRIAPLNKHLLESLMWTQPFTMVMAPAAGQGASLSFLTALLLWASTQHSVDGALEIARQTMRERQLSRPINLNPASPTTIDPLDAAYDAFVNHWLPKLVELGVVFTD